MRHWSHVDAYAFIGDVPTTWHLLVATVIMDAVHVQSLHPSNSKALLSDRYEYVMHGKIFKFKSAHSVSRFNMSAVPQNRCKRHSHIECYSISQPHRTQPSTFLDTMSFTVEAMPLPLWLS